MLKNIKEFVGIWKTVLKDRISKLENKPKLAIVQIGAQEASNRYVKNKVKDCQEIGIEVEVINLEESVSTIEVCETIKKNQRNVDGIIVQMPLPEQISKNAVIEAIDIDKDVDGFKAGSKFKPATPLGIMKYLDYCEFDLAGKDVCILGRSETVGKPLAQMMMDADATVTVVHSKSNKRAKDFYSHNVDLVVSAVGKPKFLNCYSIHVPVIDVGINFIEEPDGSSKMVGDCFNTEDRMVTPVPGGVGLLTRCALLDNVVEAASKKSNKLKANRANRFLNNSIFNWDKTLWGS